MNQSPPSRLARRLDLGDAVVIGLGSMIGAGVFTAAGPAAAAAGWGLLVGLVLAGGVAYCNATSSAALAAVHPASGGTYVYGREQLGPFWGHLAGWAFVVGKTASCAAMAFTIGAHVAPSAARGVALAAVMALTAVNYLGVQKTATVTRVLVATVLAVLLVVVVATAFGGSAGTHGASIGSLGDGGFAGTLRAAGLLFFAFAGYARIATLGEEVVDPARTIPKAIPRALGVTLVVYTVVLVSALLAAGPDRLAESSAPLVAAVEAGDLHDVVPVVRIGGAVAAVGVLLSLIAGVSRTTFAMAANGDLPRWLDAVHPVNKVPHRADLAIGALVAVVVAVGDLRGAIGFSSFCVLGYYAIANASAWTLPPDRRRWPRALAAAGLFGCLTLAFTLPLQSVIVGAAVLAAGAVTWMVRQRR